MRFLYAKPNGVQLLKGKVMCTSKKVVNKKVSLSNNKRKGKEMGVRRFSASCVLLVVFCSLTLAQDTWTKGTFEIHVFRVGQADSQLIVSPRGKTLLIDVGELSWNSGRGAQLVANKIRQVMGADFNHLDYVVATHLRLDHIGYVGKGGIWALIENHGFTVGTLIDRDAGIWNDLNQDGQPAQNEITWYNAGTTSGTGWRWLGYVTNPANAKKLNRQTAEVDSARQINLGRNITVTIIQSDAEGVKMQDGRRNVGGNHVGEKFPPSENDYSITLKVTFGKLDYVTGGDTDGEYATSAYGYTYNDVETVIAPKIGQVEILRVNHHGSAHSSNQIYIDILDPDVSLISCGNNSYGHPSQTTLDRLFRISKVYLTERGFVDRDYGKAKIVNGDIVIRSRDGVKYTVNGKPYVASDPDSAPVRPIRSKPGILDRFKKIERK